MSPILNIFNKIKRHIASNLLSLLIISDDKNLFKQNYNEVFSVFKDTKDSYDFKKYVMLDWDNNRIEIEKFFEEKFSFNFLRHPLLKSTMFAHLPTKATQIQKKLIKEIYGSQEAEKILKEHNTGRPILNDFKFKTSGNSIHHLYHIAKFKKEINVDITNLKSLVELGGGYGNFIKIAKKLNPNLTCTIIDIPIFSFIQTIYLRTIFGKDAVVLFNSEVGIVENKINIVPFHEPNVMNLSKYFTITPDIFVSTWALSESNQETQNLMRTLNFFSAKYLLLAYQKANSSFAYAEQITKLSDGYSVVYNNETEYLKDNYYLFAKRK